MDSHLQGIAFQQAVINDYYDVLMLIDITSIAVLNIHGVHYPCIIYGICKKKMPSFCFFKKADF